MKKSFYKRLFGYIGRYKAAVAALVIASVVAVAAELSLPILFGMAVDRIAGKGEVDFAGMAEIFVYALILTGAAASAQWIAEALCNRIANGVTRAIREDCFRALVRKPIGSIDRKPAGEILSVEIGDADKLSEGLLLGFSRFFTGVMTIAGTLFCMLAISPPVAAAVALVTPLSLLTAKFVTGRTYRLFGRQSEIMAEQTAIIEESLAGLRTVKAYNAEKDFSDRFDESNAEYRKRSLKAVFFSSLTNPTTRFVNAVVYAAVVLIGALSAVYGNAALTAGALMSLLGYANRYTKPFNEISSVITELSGAKASGERLFSLAGGPVEDGGGKELLSPKGEVKFEDVSFSYEPARPLIRGLTVDVKPGEKVAIVGPTGCGKTTLINLLLRFYDVNGGRITVDGADVKDYDRQSLRKGFGMVLQDTWIRKATIRENVLIGDPEASEERFKAACRLARLDGFAERLPRGYDTPVDEDGLSQGQKQLICIARVMVCLPPMLVLDEATSDIDTRTEMKIQAAFAELTEGRTSFIVAHRLSTVRSADKILVMNGGDVVEQGTHDELLAAGGFYAALYNSQFEQ